MLTLDKFSDLKTRYLAKRFHTFNEVVSTNETAKQFARDANNAGAVIVADCQTGGKGRQGRGWYSPAGLGLWFSIILPAENAKYQYSLIPLMTSLAVAEAVDSLELQSQVKWPNDVLIRKRKVCGILAEAVASGGQTSTIVLGVGINVNHRLSDFPAQLYRSSTSLRLQSGRIIDRSSFFKTVLIRIDRRFGELIDRGEDRLIQAWKLRCPFLRRPVSTTQNGVEHAGVFEDIDARGRMLMRKDNGEVLQISAGEITVEENYVPGY